jgi:glycosyltransferase involved in cell wall biosynthesis
VKVLWASNSYWESPFQVGANHLARRFVERGWEAAFLSEPVSPWHLMGRPGPTTASRLKDWLRGGGWDETRRLWHYSPLSLLPPQNLPFLRSKAVLDSWESLSVPRASSLVRRHGFDRVDLLVVDTAVQHVWTRVVRADKTVFRVTDRFSRFAKATPALLEKERELARAADLVVYTAKDLEKDVSALGAKRALYLPNGVDYGHFQGKVPEPPEYAAIPRPRVVYAGALDKWFNAGWVLSAAMRLPNVSFVVIGPLGNAVGPLKGRPNIHLLGAEPHAALPAYLRHADAGMIPFDVPGSGELLHAVNPLKLYEYLACGLPVVASSWRELRRIKSPAHLVGDGEGFVRALSECLKERGGSDARRRFAARHDWSEKADLLLRKLGFPTSVGGGLRT